MTTTDPTAMTGTAGWPGAGRVSVRRTVPGQGAACADVDAEVREAFFSTDPVQIAAARRVCASCPMQLRCLAGALARDEQWGVWGGWVFGPRVIEAIPRPIPHANGRHDSSADPSADSGSHGVGWEVWTTEEASAFLASSADHRLFPLFAVGMALGLRKGELLALRWSDVDLDDGLVQVRQTVQRLPGVGLVYGTPKSARSRRAVPLPGRSVKVLRAHRARQAAEMLAAGPAWTNSGLVFTSTVGTVLEPRNLNRLFDELSAAAGVRRIRIHDLRHTCASLLLAQGVPPRVVMDVLGHSQLALTMDLYSHVMPTALREAAEAIDRALGGAE